MDRSWIGNLRLFSGLILFLFVLGHFTNHALGIISLRAMNDWLWLFIQPWRDPVGEFLLILALTVHVLLAFYSLFNRKTLNMGWKDAFQYSSGFLIPILLAPHVWANRGLHEVYGVVEGYQFTLYGLWVADIGGGIINAVALVLVWFHACLGWHMWFRLKSWYPSLKPWALGLAVLIPTLALAGYVSAGLRVSRLANSQSWLERTFKRTADNVAEFTDFIVVNSAITRWSVVLCIVAILVARLSIYYVVRRKAGAHVTYRDLNLTIQEKLSIVPGSSVLDLIRGSQISHAAVCGGRGRCSTCRVRIDSGNENLPPPSSHETLVLKRISAPPNVRLACQVSPRENISVTALLKPDAGVQDVLEPSRNNGGEEQEIAVLFADIRAFTKLSEAKLPYDTAFLLNRYFAAMGEAIESGGGHLDKFIGDGVMALFGIDQGLKEGSQKALRAASLMSERLDELNASLKDDLDEPLRIGIGIHSGTAIVGNMGYNRATGLTAIGDVVNIASRLETLTKEFGVQLVVSRKTVEYAELPFDRFSQQSTDIRGRDEALDVYLVQSAKQLKEITTK